MKVILVLVFAGLAACFDPRNDSVELRQIEAAPFTVLVMCNNNKYFCTGSIIDAEWALTAAHCLYDPEGSLTEDDRSVTVLAGVDALDTYQRDLQAGRGQARQSVKIQIHDQYSWSKNFIHDIALIKLEKPLEVTKRTAVAPLPEQTVQNRKSRRHVEDSDHISCKIYGFGKIKRLTKLKYDYYLKTQNYEVGKHCHCLEKYRLSSSPYNVLRSHGVFICDEVENYTGLCCGDNGGPLLCEGKLRGIATTTLQLTDRQYCTPLKSGQYECGDKRCLDVFTDICEYSEWIHSFVPTFPITDVNCNVNVSAYVK